MLINIFLKCLLLLILTAMKDKHAYGLIVWLSTHGKDFNVSLFSKTIIRATSLTLYTSLYDNLHFHTRAYCQGHRDVWKKKKTEFKLYLLCSHSVKFKVWVVVTLLWFCTNAFHDWYVFKGGYWHISDVQLAMSKTFMQTFCGILVSNRKYFIKDATLNSNFWGGVFCILSMLLTHSKCGVKY